MSKGLKYYPKIILLSIISLALGIHGLHRPKRKMRQIS